MSNSLIEYMKIHLTSLYQDMNKMEDFETFEWHYLKGQMHSIEHILEMYDNV